ncbi:MAG: L,D-transpeptidase family protein [Ignavibacteriales bacterium]|nr:L,D-transpeptidase family protein [Ignavibacteriales bacterium]
MKKVIFFHLLLATSLFAQIETAQKLIVAVGDGWNASTGRMYLFDKSANGWKKHHSTWNVSFGRAGLGWGIGLHTNPDGEYQKAEGDRRSPAGIFELGSLYGLDASAPEGVRYLYRRITGRTRCVDDSVSRFYNQIVEEDSATKDWSSDEEMVRVDPDYKYLLVINHNSGNDKGKGSCIFLHIINTPTTGCTAMDEEDMMTLLRWLDPNKKTLVVQLPHAVYQSFRTAWKLPLLK